MRVVCKFISDGQLFYSNAPDKLVQVIKRLFLELTLIDREYKTITFWVSEYQDVEIPEKLILKALNEAVPYSEIIETGEKFFEVKTTSTDIVSRVIYELRINYYDTKNEGRMEDLEKLIRNEYPEYIDYLDY